MLRFGRQNKLRVYDPISERVREGLVISDLVAFCLSRLLLVLQRGDVGFVEDAWAGDSGVVFDGVYVFLLFLICRSFISRNH